MAKKKKPDFLAGLDLTDEKQGFLVLLIGIGVALVLGLTGAAIGAWIFVLGIIVGILNIFHKEGLLFLILGLTLTFMFYVLAGSMILPTWATALFESVVYLLVPANIIIGIKVLYALATK